MIYAERNRGEPGGAGVQARMVVYRDDREPEVMEAAASSFASAAGKFSNIISDRVEELGGEVPGEAIREVVENLIHADYKGVVISIFDGGNSVRVSDKGPGIENKQSAFEFGFTSAASGMESIRGVGAGLGMARSAVRKAGGGITIEDNLGGGTVATIRVPGPGESNPDDRDTDCEPEPATPPRRYPGAVPRMELSDRQEKVLLAVVEYGEVGPSTVAEYLEISVSTAYRDLSVLQEQGLLHGDESGKRIVSPLGRDLVAAIIQNWVQ